MLQLLIVFWFCCTPSLSWAEQRVLVLGDSNTWGSNASGPRHGDGIRWGHVLGAALPEVSVIEEGRIGRRTDLGQGRAFDPSTDNMPDLISRHMPFDLVIVMLGTNDLQIERNHTADQVARSAFGLAQVISNASGYAVKPDVLLVVPPALKTPEDGALGGIFGRQSAHLSRQLGSAFTTVFDTINDDAIMMFDAGTVIDADGADGVHLTALSPFRLGHALAPIVAKFLEN
jgi:lysophospholipase L1-like esterase